MSQAMHVTVLGAGAWGTAMALHMARRGHRVKILPRRSDHGDRMRSDRENGDYLPGFPFADGVEVARDDAEAFADSKIVFVACPSYAIGDWCQRIKYLDTVVGRELFFISLAKGLERSTGRTPSEILRSSISGHKMGSLSGPTFAGEVAEGKPAAMTLAAESEDSLCFLAQEAISGPEMRIYLSNDLKGVELGGCLKNVYAIAAGCCQGLGLGDNAQAALLTRALAEMVKVGMAMGAKVETFYGLSGFGDLVATCHGEWSRNRTFGEAIARGEKASAVIAAQKTVVEGYRSSKAFFDTLHTFSLDAPILSEVYSILYEDKAPKAALLDLMGRDLKREWDI